MEKNINSNGYAYIDLNLPSGTLWATQNIGALNASDCGLYFAFGEVKGYLLGQIGTSAFYSPTDDNYKEFKWSDYKYSHDGKTFTKYAFENEVLDLNDDAAFKGS